MALAEVLTEKDFAVPSSDGTPETPLSLYAEKREATPLIPEILRERGLVTSLGEYQGDSLRLQGLQLLQEVRPAVIEKYGVDFFQPHVVVLQDALFRTFVESGSRFPEEIEDSLIALIQQSLQGSETKMLSVRRAYWTPENPDPAGPPFNALIAPEEVLGAIVKHYQYCIEQGWHQRPDTEVSLNLQEFTDPPDIQIEDGILVSETIPFGGEIVPLGSSHIFRVHVLPGDNRAVTVTQADSITVDINSGRPHIVDRTIVSKLEFFLDRDGTLVPYQLPPNLHIGFCPLNDMDALRLCCVTDELEERTGRPYRIEFSAGTRRKHPVIFINEALPYEEKLPIEARKEPEIIKGKVVSIIRDREDIIASRRFRAGRGQVPMAYIDPILSTDTTRLRLVLSRLAREQKRRQEEIICLYPGTETEHAFRLLAREVGLTGFPVIPGRRFRPGDRVEIRTDGVEHTVINQSLAGNRYGLCLQEYPGPLTDLQIGNKAAGLLDLFSLNLPVPPAFVLPKNFFLSVLRKNGLLSQWGRLTKIETLEDLRGKFTELREGLTELPVGHWDKFLRLLASHLDLKRATLIARSSGNVEDLAARSFTGEFETIPHLTLDNLEGGVLKVIHSPFTDKFARSIWELPGDEGRRILAGLTVPVLAMPQVFSEVSGTLFHCDTVTGNPNIITVEAQPGIGGVVAGEKREKTLRIKFDARTKNILSILIIEGGREYPLESLTTRKGTLLTPHEAMALFKAAELIHRRTNEYHDTEWGIGALPGVLLGKDEVSDHRSQLWFFQTRPVQTSL